MKKMNKLGIWLGFIGALSAPVATIVSCGQKKAEGKWPVSVQNYSILDSNLALGVNVFQSTGAFKKYPHYLYEINKYKSKLEKINFIDVPFNYSRHVVDPEFWRSKNGGKEYTMSMNQNIFSDNSNLGRFAKSDNIVSPVLIDLADGIKNNQYTWNIDGGGKLVFKNDQEFNNAKITDGYPLFDMETILRKYSKNLDKKFGTKSFSKKASKIIKVTQKHWKSLNRLQEKENSNLKSIDFNKKSYSNSDDPHSEKILFLLIKADKGEQKIQIFIGTPSTTKDFITKTHFSLPDLSKKQINAIMALTQKNIVKIKNKQNYYEAKIKYPSLGVKWKISNDEKHKVILDGFNGKVDKLIISTYSDWYYPTHNKITYEFLNNIPKIKNLLKENKTISSSNTIITDTIHVGPYGYGGFQPIGQNVMIDKIAKQWYRASKGVPALNWGFDE